MVITKDQTKKDFAIITLKKGLTGVTTKKTLYKGTFNWFGEVHTLYTHATSRGSARTQLFKKLAKKLDHIFSFVSTHYCLGHQYTVKEVKKDVS